MQKRPRSITVIAWILIIVAGISLLKTSTISLNNPVLREVMGRSPIPVSLQYIIMYSGMFIYLISGFAMLKGKDWARSLYVIWSVISLVIGIATTTMKSGMIPGVLGFLIITFFLFRPRANEYFETTGISCIFYKK